MLHELNQAKQNHTPRCNFHGSVDAEVIHGVQILDRNEQSTRCGLMPAFRPSRTCGLESPWSVNLLGLFQKSELMERVRPLVSESSWFIPKVRTDGKS
jgi:hypothetical protein